MEPRSSFCSLLVKKSQKPSEQPGNGSLVHNSIGNSLTVQLNVTLINNCSSTLLAQVATIFVEMVTRRGYNRLCRSA